MTVSEDYPAIRLGGLSNRFYRNPIVCFREQKPFCFENSVFSYLALACVRESVRAREVGNGELHSHPYHVDIQVGSFIFLNVFMLNSLHVHLGGE